MDKVFWFLRKSTMINYCCYLLPTLYSSLDVSPICSVNCPHPPYRINHFRKTIMKKRSIFYNWFGTITCFFDWLKCMISNGSCQPKPLFFERHSTGEKEHHSKNSSRSLECIETLNALNVEKSRRGRLASLGCVTTLGGLNT